MRRAALDDTQDARRCRAGFAEREGFDMNAITTKDGASMFFKDRGNRRHVAFLASDSNHAAY